MTDKCIYCKYYSSVDGLDACAYESNLVANRDICDNYIKSWSTYIVLNVAFVFYMMILFGMPIIVFYCYLRLM